MKVETIKKDKDPNSPVIWVDNINLSVKDGIRLGFGFGVGMFFWGLLITPIVMVGIIILGNIVIDEIGKEMNSAFGFSNITNTTKQVSPSNIELDSLPLEIKKYLK